MTLPDPIEEVLDPPEIDERAVHRARSRLFGSLDARPNRRRVRPWLLAAAGLALVGAVTFALWPRAASAPEVAVPAVRAPLRLVGAPLPDSLHATDRPRVVRFDDGSRVRLAPGATLHVRRNEPERIDLALARGDVRFDIRPNGPRRWRIAMGPWEVEVVGTRFSLSRSAARVQIAVERGLVRVSSENGVELLGAGASKEQSLAPEPADPVAPVDSVDPVEAPDPVDPVEAPEPRPARWRVRADRGDAQGAYALIGDRFAAEVRAARDAQVLFALADVARLSGHPEDAIAPLHRIVEDFPQSRRAAVAAYTLGLLYADSLQRPADAAPAFERAASLGLPAPLQEPAASRRLAAWIRAARPLEIRRAACDYLAAHPDGPARPRAEEACPSPAPHQPE